MAIWSMANDSKLSKNFSAPDSILARPVKLLASGRIHVPSSVNRLATAAASFAARAGPYFASSVLSALRIAFSSGRGGAAGCGAHAVVTAAKAATRTMAETFMGLSLCAGLTRRGVRRKSYAAAISLGVNHRHEVFNSKSHDDVKRGDE